MVVLRAYWQMTNYTIPCPADMARTTDAPVFILHFRDKR
jgi:hypothetical protein